MARANVNIDNVVSFRQSIEAQREGFLENIGQIQNTIGEITEQIYEEQEKATSLQERLQNTAETLLNKLNDQQEKVDTLQESLSVLEANEPMPAEVLVSEPDVYDEEGNLVSAGDSHYEETSAHVAWRDEVAQLQDDLQEAAERLKAMQAVSEKLQIVAAKLEEQQDRLKAVSDILDACLARTLAERNQMNVTAESATAKLKRIEEVLQEYLAASICSTQGFWSRVMYPGATISGMDAGKFSVSRVPAMMGTFDDSPEWIRSQIADYGNNVTVKDVPCRSHYTPCERKIYMDSRYDDDEYADVFKHEFGHYIDHTHDWLSQTPDFIDAYQNDCEQLRSSTRDGNAATDRMMTKLMNGNSAKYDRCVSDILSATYYNDSSIVDRYWAEGLPFYQHDDQYWARENNRENEVFANLFAIYSNNDQETVRFIEEFFPNTNQVFKKVLS